MFHLFKPAHPEYTFKHYSIQCELFVHGRTVGHNTDGKVLVATYGCTFNYYQDGLDNQSRCLKYCIFALLLVYPCIVSQLHCILSISVFKLYSIPKNPVLDILICVLQRHIFQEIGMFHLVNFVNFAPWYTPLDSFFKADDLFQEPN